MSRADIQATRYINHNNDDNNNDNNNDNLPNISGDSIKQLLAFGVVKN